LKEQLSYLHTLSAHIEKAIKLARAIETARTKAIALEYTQQSQTFCKEILPICQELRHVVDAIESMVDDNIWQLPKYRELLFIN